MGLTRKQIKKDEVRTTLETVFDWLLAHQIQIIAGLAILIVVVLGGWGWTVYRQGVNSEANAAFADALDKYHAPVGDEGQDAPAGTFRYRYDTEEAKLAEALPAFQLVADDYSGTSVGPWAQLYVAVIQQEQGDAEKAEETFRRLASGASVLEVRNLAAKRMADKARQSGNLDEAVTYCRQILDNTAVNFPVEGTLLTLAEVYEELGDTESALEQYRILQAEHPNSPQAQTAESKIEELAPPLLGDAPPETPDGQSPPQPQER